MQTTPTHKIPYLTPTDKAKDIPVQSKAIAETLDAKISDGSLRGPQGIPGTNGVATDTAVGTYVGTEGTATRTAIESVMDEKVDGAIAVYDNSNTLKSTVQTTPVDPRAFLPVATVAFKQRNGYRYETVRVKMSGYPRPGVLRKVYANNFERTSPGGDQFIVPEGQQETIQSMANRTAADVVSNSTGWQTATGPTFMMLRGPQIKDGVIYRDFEPNSNRGRHCLGVHADGTILPYKAEDGWTAASMKAAGVVDTFTFGPLLTENGITRNVEADTWASSLTGGAVSARTILGVMANHEIVLITVVGTSADGTGVGGNNIAELAAYEGLVHSILLDGGGSTQAMAAGATYHPSSDMGGSRLVGDALLIHARVTQVPDSSLPAGPEPITLATGYKAQSSTYPPTLIVRGGFVSMQGGIAPNTGLFPGGAWVTIGQVPDKARPKVLPGAAIILPAAGGNDSAVKVQIRDTGELLVRVGTDTGYVQLGGVSYAAY